MVERQGGDPRVCDAPEEVLPKAPIVTPLLASRDGVLGAMDALEIGLISVRLGAGRNTKEEDVDPAVGLVFAAKPGEAVRQGEPLCWVHARTDAKAQQALASLDDALKIHDDGHVVDQLPLFIDAVHGA